MIELSAGWVETPLESVVRIHDGKRVPINATERDRRTAGKSMVDLYPYYGATGQVGLIDDYLFDGPFILLGEDGVPFFDPLKHKAYRVNGKFWVNNHAHVLQAMEGVSDYRFLEAFLNSFDYRNSVSGSTRLKLTQAAMREIPVRLAPFNEQKRITDKLDAVLAHVDACRERLDRIPAILKRFRQSVLAAATSGKLTEEWRHRLSPKEVSWESTTFATVCDDITVGFVGKMSSEYRNEGIPFLRSLNVRPFRFDAADLRFISKQFHRQLKKSALKPGDVVVVRTGAPGQCCVIPEHLVEANCSDLVIVRPGPKLLPEFACIFINAETSQSFVRSEQVGVAQLHFNVGSMKITPLSLPSLAEQKEIARRVQLLFDYADRIESRHTTARAQVERFTPALLAKAFRGELVPQDPNDEPAATMLSRIRATKRVIEKAPKRSREIHMIRKARVPSGPIPVVAALEAAGKPLTGQELLAQAGYPPDATADLVEAFFIDIRSQLSAKPPRISRTRQGDQDVFMLVS